VKYSRNKSQQDVLFLKFISVKNSTCFSYILTLLADINITSMTNTYCCV